MNEQVLSASRNKYALTLVLKNEMEEKAKKEVLDSVKKKIGTVEKEELWGSRDLSYPIKHQTKGYYVHFEFETEPSKVAPIDKALKLDEDIIRYLLVRV